MKKNLLFILIIAFTSCKTVSQSMQGQYYDKGKDYRYDLNLRSDSSFTFSIAVLEGLSTCDGKWHYLSKDIILLSCNEQNLSAKLQRGYMTERERNVIVLSKNKLKIANVILKRRR